MKAFFFFSSRTSREVLCGETKGVGDGGGQGRPPCSAWQNNPPQKLGST